jgi:quercetin dioxygenase-like cupin family protein
MKTTQMTAAEIAERTARFSALQPMSTMKDNERVSQAAKDIIFARKIMPIVLERTKNPFGDTAAIFGAGGLTMNISVCPPGQGPGLHCHHNTHETFFVLQGAFEFHIGDHGEQQVRLNQWDTFSCPPGVCRGFVNVDDRDSVLLTVITGPVNARDDVSLPVVMAERLEALQPGVLPEFQALGLAFTAGIADDRST